MDFDIFTNKWAFFAYGTIAGVSVYGLYVMWDSRKRDGLSGAAKSLLKKAKVSAKKIQKSGKVSKSTIQEFVALDKNLSSLNWNEELTDLVDDLSLTIKAINKARREAKNKIDAEMLKDMMKALLECINALLDVEDDEESEDEVEGEEDEGEDEDETPKKKKKGKVKVKK